MGDTNMQARPAAADGTDLRLVVIYGATMFLSALLLFSVQPLFAKMVLPRLGGTPAVWSVATVFFQATLLAGYLYSHLLVRRLAFKAALLIHGIVISAALAFLPLAVASGFETPPAENLPIWLLALFTASVGLPFFAVSANAPLLQAWFARTGHRHAADPYFLYGASNLGSFLALLSYPVLVEPFLTLGEQAWIWTAMYIALAIAVLGCGALIWRQGASVPPTEAWLDLEAPTSMRTRLSWMGWAFVPSALLVASTAHLSTNIAAAPFLWVMPLAIFLLTFVLTFQREPLIPQRALQVMLPIMVTGAFFTVLKPAVFGMLGGVAVNLFALFVVAAAWHGELFARRPGAARLTEFYVWMSAGGVLGGAFTSLVAPVTFDTVAEFPILLVAALLASPDVRGLMRRPLGLSAAGLAAVVCLIAALQEPVDFRERSFFGVTTVEASPDGVFRLLGHGTTIHGAERLADIAAGPGRRPEPLTYYTEEGPLAVALRTVRAIRGGPLAIAAVGLGTGSMACHVVPGDVLRFFEIDPAVVSVARNPQNFTFLSACAPDAPVVLGDARLTIAAEPAGSLDLIIVDAFSSDAIPAHLMTREALALYVSKLKPGGVVAMHISNKFLELASVVGATARAEGLAALGQVHNRSAAEMAELRTSTQVALIARDAGDLDRFKAVGFSPIPASTTRPWTDDYSNIVGAMLRREGL